jgi:hypothetical protein
MDAASAIDHARLTADLETDRASRAVAEKPIEPVVAKPFEVAEEPAITADEAAEDVDTSLTEAALLSRNPRIHSSRSDKSEPGRDPGPPFYFLEGQSSENRLQKPGG